VDQEQKGDEISKVGEMEFSKETSFVRKMEEHVEAGKAKGREA